VPYHRKAKGFGKLFPDPEILSALRTELSWTHLRELIGLYDGPIFLVQNFPYLLEVAEPVQVLTVPEALTKSLTPL
jgi:hypothetical protein